MKFAILFAIIKRTIKQKIQYKTRLFAESFLDFARSLFKQNGIAILQNYINSETKLSALFSEQSTLDIFLSYTVN